MNFPQPLLDPEQPIKVRGARRFAPLLLALALMSAALLLLIALLGVLFRVQPVTVTVQVDGAAQTVMTTAPTVGVLLGDLEIPLAEGDTVTPALSAALEAGMLIRVQHARSVTLTLDGQTRQLRTHLTHPAAILEALQITVASGDRLVIDGTPADADALAAWPVPVSHILVQRAASIGVIEDGRTQTFETLAATVGDALYEAGITLYVADRVTPALDTAVRDGLTITIERSRPVTISADGLTLEARARGGTVADALDAVDVSLVGLDYSIPAEGVPLQPGMRIRVIRVREEMLIEESTRPYQTIYQADSTLELDQRAVVQGGVPGIIRTTTRIRYENEIEVSRAVDETTVLQDVVDEVIAYGTNVVLRTIETPEGPLQYWRRLRMYATSYHPAALGGDNITSIGRVLTKGIIASDPQVIPYGTRIYVAGYGVGEMADTGGPRRRLWVDLGYDDSNWVSWSSWVDVYLLAPAPAEFPLRIAN